jgi:hypothetical protein
MAKTKFALGETEAEQIIQNLIDGKDLNRWTLLNAVTSLANEDHTTYTRASELEQIGGRILAMPKADWAAVVSEN